MKFIRLTQAYNPPLPQEYPFWINLKRVRQFGPHSLGGGYIVADYKFDDGTDSIWVNETPEEILMMIAKETKP